MFNHNIEPIATRAVSNTLVRPSVLLLPPPSQPSDHANTVNGNTKYPLQFDQVLALSKTYSLTPFHNENVAFPKNIAPPPAETLPAVIEAQDEYHAIRKTSERLTNFSKADESSFLSEVEQFINLDVSTSTKDDIDTGKRLVKKTCSTVDAIDAQANHISTFHKVQVGKVAYVLQGLVKQHKLGNWKELFNIFFKGISYESVNNWKNVAAIPMVDDWLFLDIWKLIKLRSAYIALGIKSDNPLKELSEILCIRFTEDITERQLKRIIDREKFKKSIAENSISLDDSSVDDLAAFKEINLNTELLKKFKDIQESGGKPTKLAEKLIANKAVTSPIKKTHAIPDILAFDEMAGPLIKLFEIILKTPAEEVNLEFKLLDQLINKTIEIDRHFSRNIFNKQA